MILSDTAGSYFVRGNPPYQAEEREQYFMKYSDKDKNIAEQTFGQSADVPGNVPGDVPEGFTLKLALVDALPVAEFCAGTAVIACRFKSALFSAGAGLSALAGCGKVLWKILLAVKKKNAAWLNRQFRYLMSGGFALMAASLIANRKRIQLQNIAGRIAKFPAAAFFGAGAAGMCAMGIMGAKLDKHNARHNWIEQITNLISQGLILAGIISS